MGEDLSIVACLTLLRPAPLWPRLYVTPRPSKPAVQPAYAAATIAILPHEP